MTHSTLVTGAAGRVDGVGGLVVEAREGVKSEIPDPKLMVFVV